MTLEEIICMAQEAGVSIRGHYDETGSTPAELQRFYLLVVAAEREACIAAVKTVKTTFEAQDRIVLEAVLAIRERRTNGLV